MKFISTILPALLATLSMASPVADINKITPTNYTTELPPSGPSGLKEDIASTSCNDCGDYYSRCRGVSPSISYSFLLPSPAFFYDDWSQVYRLIAFC
jgi:hypothetical protein